MKTHWFISLLLSLAAIAVQAQTAPVAQWHHLDPTTDKAIGISTDKAYELLKRAPAPRQPVPTKPRRPVIVAVIDGGLDLNHEDLKAVIWTNPKEVAGNGKDDDRNGYVDDVYGWNFLVGEKGQSLQYAQAEETRLYARLKPLYGGDAINRASLTPVQQREYDQWTVIKPYFEKKRAEAEKAYRDDLALLTKDRANVDTLKKAFGVNQLDTALLHKPPTTDSRLFDLARRYYWQVAGLRYPNADSLLAYLDQFNADRKARLDYAYNLQANDQMALEDEPGRPERHYGNADSQGPRPDHGTHVAGIIAASRTNDLGVAGIADQVQIMAIRAIPAGDERDKDVANAIRYAVDKGASIINMSFGKYLSSHKILVDDAMHYADQKGVLLICAAGNERLNVDSIPSYPTSSYLSGKPIPNLITVGASGRLDGNNLAASFTNYGQRTVDVFAPGVQIWSCWPGNRYRLSSGTSMATPVVAGIAAVLKSNFPNLSPADLKRLIMQSAVVYHTQVLKPGTKQKVDFATLSKTGGIVNLYEAVKLAISEQAEPTKR